MSRIDNHDFLIHFTKSTQEQNDIDIFFNIINESTLNCGSGYIKGGECCICFTETPNEILANDEKYMRKYSKFGIMFKKDFIFRLGGRPVIYSKDDEFYLLPEELKYRHVRLDLLADIKIDFTWEREWRLRKEKLDFTPDNAILIFPNKTILNKFIEIYKLQITIENDVKYEIYSSLGNSELIEAFLDNDLKPTDFNWKVIFLDEN